MKKRVKKDDKFSSTEVGALIESLRAEIKPVLEAVPDMQKKLDSIFEQVGVNTQKLGTLETAAKTNRQSIEANRQLIEANRQLIEANRQLIERVLEELKSKVDSADFKILEKKVASLTG